MRCDILGKGCETVLNIPTNLKIEKEEYISVLQIVYLQADKLLRTPMHIHYTDHSISHSERILNIISSIVENTSVNFNDEEKFILIAAVLLHDVGMQTPYYDDLGSIPLGVDDLEKIRKKHHEYSEKLIIDSIQCSQYEKYYFGLNSKEEFVDDIALVAKYHRKFDLTKVDDDAIGDNVIRLKLLSALIRLGDCLDLDYRRVDIKRLLVFTSIPIESKFFWYAHHYVNGLLIKNQKINIYFRFPKAYEKNNGFLDKIVKHLVDDEIRRQIDEVYEILDEYGIRFYKDIIVHKQFSNAAKKMPPELEKYIENLGKDVTYKGVIYGQLNIVTREALMDAYVKSLSHTESYRNMIMGPVFLSPDWYRERVMANRKYKDFDSLFFQWVLEKTANGINDKIKLIFTNTVRYGIKIKDFLTPGEYKKFRDNVLENVIKLWGVHAEKGPMVCCVDPGYMHIITASDTCAIITQRAGITEPTHKGYITTNIDEIEKISKNFDEIFSYNYTNQKTELNKLLRFINQVMECE